MEWQSIDTAPKDGTVVLIYDQDTVMCGYWDDGLDDEGDYFVEPGWIGYDPHEETTDLSPQYWMPLPKPPINESVK